MRKQKFDKKIYHSTMGVPASWHQQAIANNGHGAIHLLATLASRPFN